jgi:hypothetical protein
MCCRGSGSDSTEPTALGCTLEENSPCGGTVEQAINKCNTVISSIYVVPSTATTLTVQTHDGEPHAAGARQAQRSSAGGVQRQVWKASCRSDWHESG